MRSRLSDASASTRAVTAVILLVCLSAIAVGVVDHPSGAAARSTHATTVATPAATPAAGTSGENAILYFAAREMGVANCNGGGGFYGPTDPSSTGCTKPGFGCMSLAQFAVYQGTNGKVQLSGIGARTAGGTFIPPPKSGSQWAGLKPGDVTFWGGTIDQYYHSGVYVGNGTIIDAVGNDTVGLRTFGQLQDINYQNYDYTYDGAIRYASAPLLAVITKSLVTGSVYTTTQRTYSDQLYATAGRAPYRWSLTKGSKPLPPGLSLSAGGLISGRAAATGTYPIMVQVSDTKTTKLVQASVTRSLTLKIS